MHGLATKLRRLRKGRGWSQKQLADIAQIPQSTISEIESGKRINPGVKTIEAIASALGVSVTELIEDGPKDKSA
ncbi:helix-turn-helix protein [Carboxydocella thermautotrophica]|nr:helix-turn-helix protein [Carboxydocella thermautotrophica]